MDDYYSRFFNQHENEVLIASSILDLIEHKKYYDAAKLNYYTHQHMQESYSIDAMLKQLLVDLKKLEGEGLGNRERLQKCINILQKIHK